jgi:hypothetical protein
MGTILMVIQSVSHQKRKKKGAGVVNMMKVVKLLSILMGFPCLPHTYESFIKQKKKQRERKNGFYKNNSPIKFGKSEL